MNNKYKRFAALGLIPFLMSGCSVKNADVVEPMASVKSIDELHNDFYDVYVTAVQTDKGVIINSNNSIVEDILKGVLPYDLSSLNIESIKVTRMRDQDGKNVHIDICGSKGTSYKYSAEKLLDSLMRELIDNNIANKDEISLNVSYFEFDKKTSFPKGLDILSIDYCTGILSEKEVISRDFVCVYDSDLFLLDKENFYPKVETLFYCPHTKEIDIESSPEYLQQMIDYISPFCEEDYCLYISSSAKYKYENSISYEFDLDSISSKVDVILHDDSPAVMDIHNVKNIELEIMDQSNMYNKEKSDKLNNIVMEQFEDNECINITVSNIGNEPSIYLGSNKKISN